MMDLMPQIWREIPERYTLLGCKCATCGTEFFPQRKICPLCRRKGRMEQKQMPTEGVIASFTEIHSAPSGFEHETPYFLALIDLGNGVRVLSQLVDSPMDRVRIGAKAAMRFRKIFEDGKDGIIAYGFKFQIINGE